jgi:hypothetical protein
VAFTGHLEVSGSHGTVTFTQASGSTEIRISSFGAVSTPASLKAGAYTARGTDKDSLGDTGARRITLLITSRIRAMTTKG